MAFFPTNHYPGIYWPGSRQVEAGLPVTAAPPFFDQLTADNIAASGIRETIVLRSEERRQLTFFGLDALETAQWGQYFTERGGRGQQAELLVDRFTGRALTFANTVADQNSEPVSAYLATPSYQIVQGKIGLVTPASRSAAMFASNIGSVNATAITSEGTVVVTMVCSFAGNDGLNHTLFIWGNQNGFPYLLLKKFNNNVIVGRLRDSNAAFYTAEQAGSVNWLSGTILSFILQWTSGQSLGLWVSTQASGLIQTTISISGAPVTGLSSLVSLAGDSDNTEPSLGILLHAAIYKHAYADPTVLLSHFPLGRNYYSRAEVIERTFNPTRISQGVDAWQWTWTFRQGF